mgnify:CR=1 FL=1
MMNNTPTPLGEDFFHRDCLDVAPDLVGKLIITPPVTHQRAALPELSCFTVKRELYTYIFATAATG